MYDDSLDQTTKPKNPAEERRNETEKASERDGLEPISPRHQQDHVVGHEEQRADVQVSLTCGCRRVGVFKP